MISNGLSIQITFEMLNLSWQTVSLTSIFSEAPFVIVSGSHSTHHGRMPIEHNSIATWVEVRRETHFVIYWEIFPTGRALIGYFEVTWHLTMKLFSAKISERAKSQNLWRQRVTREIKIHFYRKRQTSDSGWEFLRIGNKQIKTDPNDSYG